MKNTSSNIINIKNNKIGEMNFFIKHKKLILALLLIISYVLFYFLIDFSTQSLVAHDEGLYARRSRLVEESYNWFSAPFPSPHHKTLGSYWFIALSLRFFGNNELALRLPSILSSFLCLFITYLITIKISNKKTAFITLFSLSSMPLWIQYSRYASPDIPFVLCILLVILFFLKFIDSSNHVGKCTFIFISGLFISTSFFIRSYMVFVPIIGLSPFLLFHLLPAKNIYKIFFLNGILFGSIPTILNLYYSYKKFGSNGITALFDFAKKQAIGGFDFNNLILVPLNYLYYTFPVGILFLILFVFTRPKNNNVNHLLLIYCYPCLSLLILLFMSTSYPHYYLFLLPSLSTLLALYLQTFSFRYLISKTIIKYLLLLLVVFICFTLVSFVMYFDNSLANYPYRKLFIVYIVPIFLTIYIIFSSRYLFDTTYNRFNLIKFLFNIIIPQYIFLSLLFNFGLIGNPNHQTKLFVNDTYISSIIHSNTIYLYNVNTKIKTLLSFYLPSSKVLKSLEDLNKVDYVITSDRNLMYTYENKDLFKLISSFDNHFLLMKISK